MAYLHRNLEEKFLRMSDFFKAVLVTGARQVGKTTMLKELSKKQKRTYVSMDDIQTRELAKKDAAIFFQMYKPPVLIDEIQKAPELFERIKIICDETEQKGLFWLTGSQRYGAMKNVRESLAGRIGILELDCLSLNEKRKVHFAEELEFSFDALTIRQNQAKIAGVQEIFENIIQGGMPALLKADMEQRGEYYNSYIDSYLLRDATESGGIRDTVLFRKFLEACAALTGEMLNIKTLADSVQIAQATAKQWLEILEGLGIIFLLQPFYSNQLKRLAKRPKLYFCDTGLCAHLARWKTADTLLHGAVAGHYFENFVIAELKKTFASQKNGANLYYYRDQNAKEIDVIVEQGQELHPFEIKLSATPDSRQIKKFSVLSGLAKQQAAGGIICMCEKVMPIDENNCVIPAYLL